MVWLARAGVLTFASALALAACGKSSDDEPAPGAGTAGVSVSAAGAGGSRAGSGGKGGASGASGSSGRASGGAAGSAGTSGGVSGGGAGGRAGDAGRGGSSGAGSGGTDGGQAGTDAGDAGAGGAGDDYTLPEVLEPLVEAFCSTARTCCGLAGQPAGALEDCENGEARNVYNFQLVFRGNVAVNTESLAACIAAYEAAATSCEMAGVLAACHGIFRGTLADGEPCIDVKECDRSEGPRFCSIVTSVSDVGTCVDPVRGELETPCLMTCSEQAADCSINAGSFDANPDPLAFCFESDGLYCAGGTGSCAELIDEGEECPDGIGCHSSMGCGVDGALTCEPLRGLGDECFFTPDCAPGLICEDSECVAKPFADEYTCFGTPPDMD